MEFVHRWEMSLILSELKLSVQTENSYEHCSFILLYVRLHRLHTDSPDVSVGLPRRRNPFILTPFQSVFGRWRLCGRYTRSCSSTRDVICLTWCDIDRVTKDIQPIMEDDRKEKYSGRVFLRQNPCQKRLLWSFGWSSSDDIKLDDWENGLEKLTQTYWSPWLLSERQQVAQCEHIICVVC